MRKDGARRNKNGFYAALAAPGSDAMIEADGTTQRLTPSIRRV